MAPIKVAHITTVDLSLRMLLQNQLASLRQAGYDVVGVSSDGPHVAEVEAAGVRHVAVPISRRLTPLADLVSLYRLYRLMRRERFTIVHTHTPKPGLLGQLAARLAGVPIVVNTLHGFYFHERTSAWGRRVLIALEKLVARCSDRILSQNREDLETALRERICRHEQIELLGNGIDLQQFDPGRFSRDEVARRRTELGISPDAPVVGFVGRLAAKRKGFLDFLAAGRRLAEQLPKVRFLIVGETDHGKPDAVEASVAGDYGIADHCVFAGQRPNDELPLLYRCFDVLVLPSLFEGLPRVVMEAAAMGVPAVVSDVKGNREAVIPDRTGRRVPWGDVAALAENVLDLLIDEDEAARLGSAARRLALSQFDEQTVFHKIGATYAQLLRDKGLSPPPTPVLAGLNAETASAAETSAPVDAPVPDDTPVPADTPAAVETLTRR